MYILLSLYLPTHLILLRLSLPPPCLSTPPLLHFLFFLLRILSFCSLSLSSIPNASLLYSLYSLSLSLSLSLPSLFGNTALFLALLFPIYASLFISLFLFLPFFLLPHWLFSLPPFFFPSSNPPSTPSFLFHSSAFRPHTPPQRPLPSSPS